MVKKKVFKSPTNAYVQVCKYVDHKGSAAMLASKRPAGVAPEMNLRNDCTQVMKHANEGSTLTLKPWTDVTRSPRQEVSVPPPQKKGMMSSRNFIKKRR